jgi:hypothetical protein
MLSAIAAKLQQSTWLKALGDRWPIGRLPNQFLAWALSALRREAPALSVTRARRMRIEFAALRMLA